MPDAKIAVYHDSIHFVGSGEKDWMGTVTREGGRWKFRYRFRYYNSADPFDVKDEKNWYGFGSQGDSPEELAQMRAAIEAMRPVMEAEYGSEMETLELQCFNDDPKFMFELLSRDWAHVKTGKEADEYLAKLQEAE
jgi:hypothetical protein